MKMTMAVMTLLKTDLVIYTVSFYAIKHGEKRSNMMFYQILESDKNLMNFNQIQVDSDQLPDLL